MFRPRVIPVLLLKGGILVKSIQFKKYRYIGDPLNAIRLFNEYKADEIVLLDIDATRQGRCISPELIKQLGEEANMPLSVGGGITSIEQIKQVVAAGAEKIVIGTKACATPSFIEEAAAMFGSATITVCMDVYKNRMGQESVYFSNASRKSQFSPLLFAAEMQRRGAGELIVQSVNNDGMMKGYDIAMLRQVAGAVTIPIVTLGGAGSLQHLNEGYKKGLATGLAAGSLFVYKGNGVLINYPDHPKLIFSA